MSTIYTRCSHQHVTHTACENRVAQTQFGNVYYSECMHGEYFHLENRSGNSFTIHIWPLSLREQMFRHHVHYFMDIKLISTRPAGYAGATVSPSIRKHSRIRLGFAQCCLCYQIYSYVIKIQRCL